MDLTLKITTLSDTQIGSGRSFTATIDSDIEFDSLGLPYIPAKRIKGLFRNAVEDLSKLQALKSLRSFDESHVEKLFGTIGSSTGSPICFDNLNIQDHQQIRSWLNYIYDAYPFAFKTHTIQDYFTTLRSQTAIDANTQTAKDHSLRTIRVLKKGFNFCGSIHLQNNEDQDAFVNALSMASLLLRRIGSQRNRGFGKVKVELLDVNGNSLTQLLQQNLEARQ